MTIKINSLELENVKRIKAIKLVPSANGLTILGGKNGQGKTSVLDAIAWALGGDRFKPSEPQRQGSVTPPILHIELSNGLIVERKGVNGSLKVIDPQGNKAGQQILNEFVAQLALDLPKFLNANNKEKANALLQIIGIGEKLYQLDAEEQRIYNRRYEVGRIADQKKKYAAELEIYPDVPKELVSAAELIKQQQEILARNGENERKRQMCQQYEDAFAKAQRALEEAQKRFEEAEAAVIIARKSALDLHDENTEALEANIADVDQQNIKIRANMDREKAEMEAEDFRSQYDDLTKEIDAIRDERIKLLESADLPLPGLSVENGELVYRGHKWDNMSGSEQLKVATAIVRKLNPNCGFVLMDKLEQMDQDTLNEFGKWLEQEQLQVIATRVSSGKECSVIIEDGYVKEDNVRQEEEKKVWKPGEF